MPFWVTLTFEKVSPSLPEIFFFTTVMAVLWGSTVRVELSVVELFLRRRAEAVTLAAELPVCAATFAADEPVAK